MITLTEPESIVVNETIDKVKIISYTVNVQGKTILINARKGYEADGEWHSKGMVTGTPTFSTLFTGIIISGKDFDNLATSKPDGVLNSYEGMMKKLYRYLIDNEIVEGTTDG